MGTFVKRCFFTAASVAIAVLPLQLQSEDASEGFGLSEGTMELLRQEMRALTVDVNTLPAAIATGDWETVADTAGRMQASYIMEQELSESQRMELSRSLPDHFKHLDAAFHREAGELQRAARQGDADIVTFRFQRMLNTCTDCHVAYAPSRFPGFRAEPEAGHAGH